MSENIVLTAADGHELDGYLAVPSGPSKAAIIVVQEVFGVNEHIKNVVNSFAARGFAAIAPAMFDRAEKNVSLNYTPTDTEKARSYVPKLKWEETPLDVGAAVSKMRDYGSVGLVGYCWGGTVAWLAATRNTGVSAAVGYYGGRIIDFIDEESTIPVMLHFGDLDAAIPVEVVEKIKQAKPNAQVYRYAEAEHGFNCDMRSSYHADSAKLALERTLEFLEKHLV